MEENLFEVKLDDLSNNQVIALLEEHLADMRATSPPESKHALDLEALKAPSVKFWTLWQGNELAGCAAYQKLNDVEAEIKSMRTASYYKNKGVASILLKHVINDAKLNGYKTLNLETGSMEFFKPARTLYKKFGFSFCQPFANYVDDPNSKFMTLSL